MSDRGGWVAGLRRALYRSLAISRLVLKSVGWLYGSALIVGILTLWAFGEIADEVLEQDISAFNRTMMLALHAHLPAPWAPIALGLTAIGSIGGIVLLGGLFGAWLLRRSRILDAVTLALVLGGSGVLTYTLKHVFRQPRPHLFPELVTESSYGFPSGHALMSFCLFGYVAFWLVSQGPRDRWRWVVGGGLLLLSVLIGMSRLFLGVHWPTDVLAGFVLAVFWLAVCIAGRHFMGRGKLKPR